MFDNVSFVTDIDNISIDKDEQGNLIVGKVTLVPIPCPRTGEIIKYQGIFKNLRFTLKAGKLNIENSLHKFYKGNNYSDYSFSELMKTVNQIEKFTTIKAKELNIKKLEFALNIITDKPAYQYLPMFSDFKHKEYDKMKSNAFWYGIKYVFTEYTLKIYDKSEMVKRTESINLNQNILRFEIQYTRNRRLPSINTLADLINKEKIECLFEELINQVEKLNCIGDEDFSDISSRDREMYFAGQNGRFWDIEKELNRNTVKDKRKRYRAIQHKISKRNMIEEFAEKLKYKYKQLIET